MDNCILITHDTFEKESEGYIRISTDNQICSCFYYEDFKITREEHDTDNEDANDNARWLAKTMLEIMKMEYNDDMAHCDWTADVDAPFPVTGKYKFTVKLEKVKDK